MTSRLETSRYRDFSQFFESIGLGLENLGLEKKSRIGLENIWSQKATDGLSQLMTMIGPLSDTKKQFLLPTTT